MTEETEQRRVCWLICMCLAMPTWHRARTQRLPELVVELAKRPRANAPN